jgi:hypothetical protein
MYGHQGEDEVSLVELYTFRINPYEDLRDLFLTGRSPKCDDLESEVAQVSNPVDPISKLVKMGLIRLGGARLAETGEELANRGVVTLNPQRGDVRDVLRIPQDRGIDDFEGFVRGSERDPDALLLKRLSENRPAGQNRKQRG